MFGSGIGGRTCRVARDRTGTRIDAETAWQSGGRPCWTIGTDRNGVDRLVTHGHSGVNGNDIIDVDHNGPGFSIY